MRNYRSQKDAPRGVTGSYGAPNLTPSALASAIFSRDRPKPPNNGGAGSPCTPPPKWRRMGDSKPPDTPRGAKPRYGARLKSKFGQRAIESAVFWRLRPKPPVIAAMETPQPPKAQIGKMGVRNRPCKKKRRVGRYGSRRGAEIRPIRTGRCPEYPNIPAAINHPAMAPNLERREMRNRRLENDTSREANGRGARRKLAGGLK